MTWNDSTHHRVPFPKAMKLAPYPVQAYLSRGFFFGAIVSVCFLPIIPLVATVSPLATVTPLLLFLACELASIILGMKHWQTRSAKVGAVGSIVLAVTVVVVCLGLATILFTRREVLKERVMQLESAAEDGGQNMTE